MASCDDGQKPEIYGPSAALDGIPTAFLEAGMQLSLQVVAERKGISKLEVLRDVVSRLDEPLHSVALDALLGVSGKRPV